MTRDLQIQISFIIPIYNEANNISGTLKKLNDVLIESNINYEIIVVNDGSTDNSLSVLERQRAKYKIKIITYSNNMGLGFAVKSCFNEIKGEYFCIIPGDGDMNSDAINKLIQNSAQADMILVYFQDDFLRGRVRRIISKLYTLLVTTITETYVQYINAPGLYKTSSIINTSFKFTNFIFISELNIKAYAVANSIKEIPVFYRSNIEAGRSLKAGSLIDIFKLLYTNFQINRSKSPMRVD